MSSHFVSDAVALAAVGLTPGRAQALIGLAAALLSAVVGGFALARSAGRSRTPGAVIAVAVTLGLVGLLLSGRHLANATGPIGSGSGRLGALLGLALGAIGVALGAAAVARARRRTT
jgi:hypothetical protein